MNRTILISICTLTAAASTAFAEETFTTKNDLNKRPVKLIAAELGVEPQQFANCFAQVTPEPSFKPSGEQQRANKAILLPCLQEANAQITNEKLDQVMDKYRGQHISVN